MPQTRIAARPAPERKGRPPVPSTTTPDPAPADAFIARWAAAEQAERTNAPPFLIELCDLLGIPRPDPAAGGTGSYRFERSVSHRHDEDDRVTTRRIDLYKRGCFILEAKQGANAIRQQDLFGQPESVRRQAVRNSPGWTQHMLRARGQAERYVRDLPPDEPAPPFLIVCDIGFCFDIYADFSGTGRHYVQFPDREGFRLYLADLARPEHRATLAAIWQDPRSLDPARRRTEVTRDVAALLARLAQALERQHAPDAVAGFLMRCLFCMFAQSVGLLPERSTFTDLLDRCHGKPPDHFTGMVGDLWRTMNAGGFSAAIGATLRRFNGGLYAAGAATAAPLRIGDDEIALLANASRRDWADVDPAIFGTLLENALTPRQRGQLGAHFTPRAFVERLVLPTVMQPLRADWDGFKAASYGRLEQGDRDGAAALLREFHARLCAVRVLDPACGTGNFLYVTMELMKRLEGEVLDALANLVPGEGDRLALAGASVDPHQFLGIEKNPRAVPVAELVLWIGYLQWHFRTLGAAPPAEPILRDFHNITAGDALMVSDGEALVRDKAGRVRTHWDGVTMKPHPVTGAPVPDEAAQVELTRLVRPRRPDWPEADFIVGNPPFIGAKYMRSELGEGYVTALWALYPAVPPSADIALFFWWRAAQALVGNKPALQRFGFITSNSIRQTFCRRVVADAMAAKRAVRLIFAIPDHPWSDGAGSAAVRIAMTVAARARRGAADGLLQRVVAKASAADGVPVVTLAGTTGRINADLSIGANPDEARPLRANERISSRGMALHGAGFIVTPARAASLGLGRVPGLERHIRPYLNGRDLTQRSRGLMVIDLFGVMEAELLHLYPDVAQHILLQVKHERDQNPRDSYRLKWWIFGEARTELRQYYSGLNRYIATVATAKHRMFCFIDKGILPDDALICIATDDAYHLGVLSSRIHVAWSLAAGGTLESRPRFNKTRCFDPFPFPDATPTQRAAIAAIAEELDAHRRTRLDTNPQLTITGLYNVLDRLRADTPLTPAERDIHDAGQVSILRQLHDSLDDAVARAYGWPATLDAPGIVAHIVALNIERQAEEAAGQVRWLRPAFQAPAEAPLVAAEQASLPVGPADDATRPTWPASEPERYVALRSLLAAGPGRPADLSRRFTRAPAAKVGEMLETLVALGQARRHPDGCFAL